MLSNILRQVLFAKGVRPLERNLSGVEHYNELSSDRDHNFGSQFIPRWGQSSLGYLAGFIAKKVIQQSSCRTCQAMVVRKSFVIDDSHLYTLTNIKQDGGLVIPQKWVIDCVISTERILRRFTSPHQLPANPRQLVNRIIYAYKDTNTQLIGIDEGRVCTNTNHTEDMLSLIIKLTVQVRLYAIAKLQSSMLHTVNVRQHNHHTTLFMGQ